MIFVEAQHHRQHKRCTPRPSVSLESRVHTSSRPSNWSNPCPGRYPVLGSHSMYNTRILCLSHEDVSKHHAECIDAADMLLMFLFFTSRWSNMRLRMMPHADDTVWAALLLFVIEASVNTGGTSRNHLPQTFPEDGGDMRLAAPTVFLTRKRCVLRGCTFNQKTSTSP